MKKIGYHVWDLTINKGLSALNKDIIWFNALRMHHIEEVGGKNASLGEMIHYLTQAGVKVPHGFATTADAYRRFLAQKHLQQEINHLLDSLNVDDIQALTRTGKSIREAIVTTPFLSEFEDAVAEHYTQLQTMSGKECRFAVRSSATAEDLPDASFAGQQETFLNVSGLPDILHSIKNVFASLYNDRAISYRIHHKFPHDGIAISAGIQQMVRSDLACSGVMFSIDTESGFDKVVFITAGYGLGEAIVQGLVNPDEFYVYKPNLTLNKLAILKKKRGDKAIKMIYAAVGNGVQQTHVPEVEQSAFCLTDAEVQQLAQMAVTIEDHYKHPVDIEWAKDGLTNELYILQARPETVKSQSQKNSIERYQITTKVKPRVTGRSVGQKIGKGKAKIIHKLSQMAELQTGDVLVTDMTDPDWEPIMKRASAIVTNRGGRTCHAAIIARELGIPAVVGCGDATTKIVNHSDITVSCAEGETGFIYDGLLNFEVQTASYEQMPALPFKIMLNVGNPERAFDLQFLPNEGVGLARLEFIINNMIGIHPKALLNYTNFSAELQKQITSKIGGYANPVEYYIERLKEGIATIAAAFYPKPVIVRFSDFKSNEYANLLGGKNYEPHEENPMLGFRGASRYIAESFNDCFQLEVEAVKRARHDMGLENIWVMIPFVRTVKEASEVITLLEKYGLKRGIQNLKIIMMCEIPSNALLAADFLEFFDGFSIGSNDLTQLTLGLDRDSGIISGLFDERDKAVKSLLKMAIEECKRSGKYIGICGQGPSDHIDFAHWLTEVGIESISLNPDTVVNTWLKLSKGNQADNTAVLLKPELDFT